MNLIYLEGCQRSGIHLLAQWMQGFMAKTCYNDNACFSLEEQFDNGFVGKESPTVESQATYIKESIQDSTITHTIISTEHPGLLTYQEIDTLIDADNPRFENIARLSLLRDPLNWMCSYAKLRTGYKRYGMKNQHGAKKSQVYSNYTMYHEEYWNRWYRSYLRWKETPIRYQVNYNIFISDEHYRKNLAQALDLIWNKKTDEKGLTKEALHGSSFKKNDSSTYLNRLDYMIPLFMAHPLPYHIIKATKDDFPEVYEIYQQAMIAADL